VGPVSPPAAAFNAYDAVNAYEADTPDNELICVELDNIPAGSED
jgi:hypothetical protein